VSRSGEVRPTRATATPALGRAGKPGLLRRTPREVLTGTNAPNEGYALTLAERECAGVHVVGADHHDVVIGVALVAAKRASRWGRGPTLHDVRSVMELLGVRDGVTALVSFAGLAHSYVAQRRFVDAVNEEDLSPTA
jgi:hypothetical protein